MTLPVVIRGQLIISVHKVLTVVACCKFSAESMKEILKSAISWKL